MRLSPEGLRKPGHVAHRWDDVHMAAMRLSPEGLRKRVSNPDRH